MFRAKRKPSPWWLLMGTVASGKPLSGYGPWAIAAATLWELWYGVLLSIKSLSPRGSESKIAAQTLGLKQI